MLIRNLSLRGKLIIIVMGVSGFVLLLTLILIFTIEKRMLLQGSEREARTLANAIAVSASPALLFFDKPGMFEAISVAKGDPNFLGALITDNKDLELASIGVPQAIALDNEKSVGWNDSGWLTVTAPILSGGETIGWVQLLSNREDVINRLRGFKFWLGFILMGGAVLSLLLASLMQRIISRPIVILSEVISRVRNSSNYSVRAEISSTDEIGELVHGFNSMLAEIDSRDQALREAQANLEAKVTERTQELSSEIIVRQRIEKALRIEEEQLKILIRFAPVALAMLDKECRFIEYSQRWPLDFGLGEQEIYQQPLLGVMPWVPSRWWVAIESALAGQIVAVAEDKVLFGSGQYHVLRWSVQPWRRPDGEIGGALLAAFLIDELVQGREEALRIAKSRTEFLANMSHELRTPLNGIIGFTELLLEDTVSPSQEEQLKIIRSSGRHLLGLINEVLDFSKLDSGRLELESAPLNLQDLSTQVVAAVQSTADEKRITLHVSFEEGVPDFIFGDQVRLKQILLNIIGNAIKFTSEGTVSLTVSWNSANSRCTMLVQDSGVGIPQEKHTTIFEPFVQADTSTSRKFGGTGLGLSICKRLIELMRGTIRVESNGHQGSKFIIEFPANPAHVSAIPSATQDPNQRFFGRVLVAEDNSVNQKLITAVLGRAGCEVVLASDGAEAVSKCAEGGFDLVLMDIQMPNMNGIEAAISIRGDKKNTVPIVALSAHVFPEDEARCLEAGMSGFITKPINRQRLFEILGTYLKRA